MTEIECTRCKGTGKIVLVHSCSHTTVAIPWCEGHDLYEVKCPDCKGTGVMKER